MSSYYIFLFLVTILCIANFLAKSSNGYDYLTYFLSGMLLVFISGLRYGVGTDYFNYIRLFRIIDQSTERVTEPGLEYIYTLGRFFELNDQFVFFIFSIITVAGFLLFFRYMNKKTAAISIFMFFTLSMFYFASFNLIRQFAAVALFLFSTKYIVESNFKKFAIMVGVACLFHFSAVVLFVTYFFLKKEVNYKKYLVVGLIVIVSTSLISFLVTFTTYGIYLDREFEHSANKLVAMLFLCVSVAVIFFNKYLLIEENKKSVILNMVFLSALTVFMTLTSNLPEIVFMRYNYYFMPALLVAIPVGIFSFSLPFRIIMTTCLIVVCCGYFYFTIEFNGVRHNIVPYKNIFEVIDGN